MAQRILKIIVNGVTGRMGRTQVTSERAPAVKAALAAVSQANAIIELFKSRSLGSCQAANYFGSSKTGSFSMSKTLDIIEEPSIRPGTWRGGAFGHTSY